MIRLTFILTSLVISTTVFGFLSCKYTVNAPERLSNIPKEATWFGGSDGGNWYVISKVISEKAFKIKIYYDSTGELIVDTIFTLDPNCSFEKIDSSTLMRSIDGFDGSKIYLNVDKQRCSLRM